MTVEQMIERLREQGYMCWHLGESTKGVWSARFCNFYAHQARRGKPGAVLSPEENNEVWACADGDTMHEAIQNVMEDICPPSHTPDLDVLLGRKLPVESRGEVLDLAAMLR